MSPDIAEAPAVSSRGRAQLRLESAMRSPKEGGAVGPRQPHLPVSVSQALGLMSMSLERPCLSGHFHIRRSKNQTVGPKAELPSN